MRVLMQAGAPGRQRELGFGPARATTCWGYTVPDRSAGAPLESRYQRFFTVPFVAISLGR
jgi:hypothetical protein